ncbi:hypothetical protein SUDANB37_03004 [Streptomyces sp. enrichment culture]
MAHPEPTAGRRGQGAGLWPSVHAERAALAADLAGPADERWATPSLCAGLSVREVPAHLTAGASLGTVRWMAGVIRCRFDFDRQVAMRLAGELGADPAETLERFRRVVASTTEPPLPVVAMLGETVVHGEDIRRPLGIRRAYPADVLTRLAAYSGARTSWSSRRGASGACGSSRTTGPSPRGTGRSSPAAPSPW